VTLYRALRNNITPSVFMLRLVLLPFGYKHFTPLGLFFVNNIIP